MSWGLNLKKSAIKLLKWFPGWTFLRAAFVYSIDNNVFFFAIDFFLFRKSLESFSTDNWAANGVGALSQVLRKICHRNYTTDSTPELCWGFKIFPPHIFYPIHWTKWETLFDTNEISVNEVLRAVVDSIAVHFWNKLSAAKVIDKDNGITAYGILANRNCPTVFAASGRYF